MKISRNKIIAAVVVIAVLIVAYFSSGPLESSKKQASDEAAASVEVNRQSAASAAEPVEQPTVDTEATAKASSTQPAESLPKAELSEAKPSDSDKSVPTEQTTEASSAPGNSKDEKPVMPSKAEVKSQTQPSKPEKTAKPPSKPTSSSPSSSSKPSKSTIDSKTGKDPYGTDPVPAGKPLPVEPQDVAVSDKAMTAYLTVSCATILDNLAKLDPEKLELVPKDGVIYAKKKVTFYEGESVFNVLQREMKRNKIHMEFENAPVFNSAYVEGINNLYEFDCGELSGWLYKVNGWFPNYGASRYQLKQGDVIEWVYTCDLGRDVGDTYNAAGGDTK